MVIRQRLAIGDHHKRQDPTVASHPKEMGPITSEMPGDGPIPQRHEQFLLFAFTRLEPLRRCVQGRLEALQHELNVLLS